MLQQIRNLWDNLAQHNLSDDLLEALEQLQRQHQRECQILKSQIQQLQSEVTQCQAQSLSYENYLEEKNDKIEQLESQLRVRPEREELTIPIFGIEELKQKLKNADSSTLQLIVHYLNLDNYNLVKESAKLIDKKSSYEILLCAGDAMRRNESLIKILSNANKDKTFVNRLSGEVEIKTPKS